MTNIPIILISIITFIYPAKEVDSKMITKSKIDINLLYNKWKLDHYKVFSKEYDLEEKEKGDYIHFNNNNTFTSVSEGKFEKGNYKLISKTIILTSNNEEGELKLIIKNLSKNKLIVIIDDPNDTDAKYVEIHFVRQ